jgi:hypothetical protein
MAGLRFGIRVFGGWPTSLEGLTTLNARTRPRLHATGGKEVGFFLYELTGREAEMHQAAGTGDDLPGTAAGLPGLPVWRPGP